MIQSYFTAAIRFLRRNRLFAAINVIGLAISLIACLLISLYVRVELSYDRHWEEGDRIFRANFITKRPGRPPQYYPISSDLMLPALETFFPNEIEQGTRIFQAGPQAVMVEDNRYPDAILFVDAALIEVFQFDVLYGDIERAFDDINSIALSEESALRYFGNVNPVGRTLSGELGEGEFDEYEVVAVYRLRSGSTVLELPNFSLYDQEKISGGDGFFQSWLRISVQTYVKLSEGTNSELLNARMGDLLDQYASLPASRLDAGQTPADVLGIELQNIRDIYLDPIPFINIDQESGDATAVLVFMVISVLVLLIGCINFVVLATALAAKRGKEVAMRKVLGAMPDQLVTQYLSESLLLTLMAFLVALAGLAFALPVFEGFVGKDLSLSLGSVQTWLYLIALFLTVGLLGGLYPAFVLSRQPAIHALHSRAATGKVGFFSLRNALVIVQFSISIVLIMGTLAIYGQLYYTEQLDPGLNTDNLITIQGLGGDETSAYKETFKQEILRLPNVRAAGYAGVGPNSGLGLILDYSAPSGSEGPTNIALSTLMIGFDFFETYQMPLLAGRYPEQGRDTPQELLFMREVSGQDTEGVNAAPARILTNATAARRLGYNNPEDAVGQVLQTIDPSAPTFQQFEIIGVVADSQYRSLRTAPDAEIFYLLEDSANLLTVRFDGDGQRALAEIEQTWNTVLGEQAFNANFVAEELANTFAQERNEGLMMVSFSLLSLMIAGLGLFGIATFNVEKRARETGLRKILGAESHQIVMLLLWQFTKPIIAANLIAWPVGIWAVSNWLARFPYQFDRWLLLPISLTAGLAALLIAWSIVIWKTTRVASASPMQALRYE